MDREIGSYLPAIHLILVNNEVGFHCHAAKLPYEAVNRNNRTNDAQVYVALRELIAILGSHMGNLVEFIIIPPQTPFRCLNIGFFKSSLRTGIVKPLYDTIHCDWNFFEAG